MRHLQEEHYALEQWIEKKPAPASVRAAAAAAAVGARLGNPASYAPASRNPITGLYRRLGLATPMPRQRRRAAAAGSTRYWCGGAAGVRYPARCFGFECKYQSLDSAVRLRSRRSLESYVAPAVLNGWAQWLVLRNEQQWRKRLCCGVNMAERMVEVVLPPTSDQTESDEAIALALQDELAAADGVAAAVSVPATAAGMRGHGGGEGDRSGPPAPTAPPLPLEQARALWQQQPQQSPSASPCHPGGSHQLDEVARYDEQLARSIHERELLELSQADRGAPGLLQPSSKGCLPWLYPAPALQPARANLRIPSPFPCLPPLAPPAWRPATRCRPPH
jgi:hypothetical protein